MTVLFYVALVLTVIFGVTLFARGARSLLGMRVGIVRLVLAGVLGFGATGVVSSSGDPATSPAFFTLQIGIALLVSMGFLLLSQAVLSIFSATSMSRLSGTSKAVLRFRRYLQIVRIAGRHHLFAAMRRRGKASPVDRTQAAARLREALEESGVVFVKFGQLLASRPDLLNVEFTRELARLQNHATPLAAAELAAVIEEDLGAPVEELFADFDPVPLAAASVAQVHRATLFNGDQVVVKVRRPGITAVATTDLDILRRLAVRVHARITGLRAVGLLELADGFAESLLGELDFRQEAANVRVIAEATGAWKPKATVVLPRIYHELTTERVLVMEYLDGPTVCDAAEHSPTRTAGDREMAGRLMQAVLKQIMDVGVFHADPHPGNVVVMDGGRLGLLDLGVVGRVDASVRASLAQLFLSLERDDRAAMRDCLLELVNRTSSVDENALERALGQLTARHVGSSSMHFRLFGDVFTVIRNFELSVPPEIAAVFRSLATVEATLRTIAPQFDIVAEARTFAASQLSPAAVDLSSLRRTAWGELASVLPVVRRLPRRLDRIGSALEEGRMSFGVRLFADRRDRVLIMSVLHQVLLSVLGATTGVMAVMLLGTEGGPVLRGNMTLFTLLGYNLLVISGVLILRVLVGAFRRVE